MLLSLSLFEDVKNKLCLTGIVRKKVFRAATFEAFNTIESTVFGQNVWVTLCVKKIFCARIKQFIICLKFDAIVGSASRECSNDAKWKDPSFLGCSSRGYILLQDQASIAPRYKRQVRAPLKNITQNMTFAQEIYLICCLHICFSGCKYNNLDV